MDDNDDKTETSASRRGDGDTDRLHRELGAMKRNHAARALADPKFRHKVVRSRKIYSRKVKHKDQE